MQAKLADKLPVRPLMARLRPGATEATTTRAKVEVHRHQEHLHQPTGTAFLAPDVFGRENSDYDTELSCRAVATMRQLDTATTLAMLEAIPKVF